MPRLATGDPVLWPAGASRWLRFTPAVWLAFLTLPLVDTVSGHLSTTQKVVVVAVVVVFAVVYTWCVSLTQGRPERSVPVLWASLPVLVAVPTFLAFYASGEWVYGFVYTAFPLVRLASEQLRAVVVALTGAATAGVAVAAGLSGSDLFAAVFIVLGTGGSWLAFGRIIEANAALRQAQEDRARAAVAGERLRFARDLHDLLGHSLSVIALKGEVAGRLVGTDADRARAEVAEITDVARRALREVREAVSGYRQATVAVEMASVRTVLADAGVTWSEDVADVAGDLSPEAEAVLAWGIREGVTNLLRHSGATGSSLVVRGGAGWAEVEITDDGAGCSEAGGGQGTSPGSGLTGLGERAAAVGGTVEAGPGPEGRGFRLRVRVPAGEAVAPSGEVTGSGGPAVARVTR